MLYKNQGGSVKNKKKSGAPTARFKLRVELMFWIARFLSHFNLFFFCFPPNELRTLAWEPFRELIVNASTPPSLLVHIVD